jgi:hypothetical protein
MAKHTQPRHILIGFKELKETGMSDQTIILQKSDRWRECMQFDLVTREKKTISHFDIINPKIRGHYATKGNDLLMIYRKNDLLYFSLNDQETCLDDPNVTVSLERIDRNNTFTMKNKEQVIYRLIYPSYRFDPVNMADFEFDDWREEDQDFCLFLYNLMDDPYRKKRIYTPQQDPN